MNEDKAARYQRLRRRAIMLGAAWSVLFLTGVAVSGASRFLRDAAELLAARLSLPLPIESAVATAVFVTILFAVHEGGVFPVAIYGSHLLDRRYGLSRQPARGWLVDHAKAVAIGWATALAAGSVVAACLRVWPAGWWIGVWAAAVVAGIWVVWATPVWILPLFFRSTPLRRESLGRRLETLAARAGVPVLGVYEWHMGERTSRANAALAGLGSTRRVLVSDTLVAEYSEDEIEVILAHELSHHVHHDVWRGLAVEAAVVGVSLWLASLVLPWMVHALSFRDRADLAVLPGLAVVTMLASTLSLPITNALARAHERRADRLALDLTRKPEAFASAIRRLATRNLADDHPSGFVKAFFVTHPPVWQRLEMARDWTGR